MSMERNLKIYQAMMGLNVMNIWINGLSIMVWNMLRYYLKKCTNRIIFCKSAKIDFEHDKTSPEEFKKHSCEKGGP